MKVLFALLLILPAQLFAKDSDADTLTFLKTHCPEIHAEIVLLAEADPDDYRSAMDDATGATATYAAFVAAEDTPTARASLKMYEIDFEAIGIADELTLTTDKAKKESLTKQLRLLIDASFSQWAIVEQARLRRLENEISELKAELEKTISDRKNVIESDLQVLIRNANTSQPEVEASK